MSLLEGEVVCDAVEAGCRCVLPVHGDDVAHECDCGGSWKGEGDDYRVLAWPVAPGLYPYGRSAAG